MTKGTETQRSAPITDEAVRIQHAYQSSVRLPLPDLVRFLVEVLGKSLVMHIAGVRDPHAVADWSSGTREPRTSAERRLRTAYRAFQIINAVDNEFAARAWFIGLNPQLDDEAPATALSEDRLKDVIVAADAFARTS